MANSLIYNILYGRVATYYNKLKKTISKLRKSSSSVAFSKKRYIITSHQHLQKSKDNF